MKIELWTRNNGRGLRAIYPDGTVYYSYINPKNEWSFSCCTRNTKVAAILAIKEYDSKNGYETPVLVGTYTNEDEFYSLVRYKDFDMREDEGCSWILPPKSSHRPVKKETNVKG